MADHREGNVVIHHEEVPEQHPERHEHTDVSIRGIWFTAAALVAVTLFVFAMLYLVFFVLEDAQKREDEASRLSAIQDNTAGPPASVPRLQGIAGYDTATPSQATLKLKDDNKARLGSYGKTDREGVVRIPVDRAIDLALQHNLFPARAPATQPAGGH
ncbi:MAG: hypothetical protein WBD40_03925 [Tepidisphaeraceae bacterium]